MEAVYQEEPFFDFGDDGLYPFHRTGLKSVEADGDEETRAAQLRTQVRQHVPRVPGVYGMLDPLGRLIYVGKSKMLRNRLLSYFLPNNEEDKAGRIVQSTMSIVWETQPSDFAALVREQYLIRHFQPRFNVQGIPRRQQPIYICIGKQPAEQIYTTRQRDPKSLLCIGPLFGAGRAARAVEVLNRLFLLRDCSSKQPCSFADQLQLFDIGLRPGCIRLEIETCLGPCISACSRTDYDRQVGLARAFLEGQNESPTDQLMASIQRASERLHFEQAAVLREDHRAVTWLYRRVCDIAQARERYTFVYPVDSIGNSDTERRRSIWYLIRRGILEGAIAAPTDAAERRKATRKVERWLAADNCVGTEYTPRPETLALITSWFRKERSELKRAFLPGQKTPSKSRRRKSETSTHIVKV